jgi:hypothetical protein
MTEPPPQQPVQFAMQVPDHLASGVYSNLMAVWHTAFEFTLDFAVTLPAQVMEDAAGQPVPVVPARVVSRVKIPPSAVFELMRALSENEALYERNVGPIPKPGASSDDPPLYPPEP